MRLGHGVVGQFGCVIERAAFLEGAIIGAGALYGELAFEGLDDGDDGAMLVAQGNSAGVNGSPMAGAVTNLAEGLDGFAIVKGRRHGAFPGTGFAIILVAMQENIFGARMAEDIDARVSGDLFGTITPENNFLMQIEHDDADLESIEDVTVNLRIFKVRHGASAIWLLVGLSARMGRDLRAAARRS